MLPLQPTHAKPRSAAIIKTVTGHARALIILEVKVSASISRLRKPYFHCGRPIVEGHERRAQGPDSGKWLYFVGYRLVNGQEQGQNPALMTRAYKLSKGCKRLVTDGQRDAIKRACKQAPTMGLT